mmetsp:Transcript_5099/g.5895  ORF Transcript_5099/g.5895 Transcript_5099/m.5895 type:complete len:129 (-) Transcript_5099:907-1293(-)
MEDLTKQLEETATTLATIQEKLASYEDLKTQLKLLNLQANKKDSKGLETLMSIGCDMYVNASVADVSMIFVNVGMDYHVEVTLKEADKICDRWIDFLSTRIEEVASKQALKKAQIRLVSEKLRNMKLP